MATYVVGDLQGCFTPLQRLLEQLDFEPAFDRLWFAGDLVSRGQHSLQVLRFVKSLGQSATCVLGNHDISLLAAAHGVMEPHKSLKTLLDAPDAGELLNWLQQRPLLHIDTTLNAVMVHAGIPPGWDLKTTQRYATEVEKSLQQAKPRDWLASMYGNK
ncbi:MAG: symmetrical bis(5'-nucleosyl)-tetraphosphatase, partial [Thiolinea sp.]